MQWWRGLTPEERFWKKVIRGLPDECWLWTGSKRGTSPYQYGCVWDGTYRLTYRSQLVPRQIGAHRYAYQLLVGEIPGGHEVCHRCDITLCVNPRHLFIGTHSDNMKDMVRKGRADNTGERNGRAKLTAKQVAYIRNQATGRYGEISSFARQFGVGTGTMSKILKHQTWTSP
jgi:hypothetical protein